MNFCCLEHTSCDISRYSPKQSDSNATCFPIYYSSTIHPQCLDESFKIHVISVPSQFILHHSRKHSEIFHPQVSHIPVSYTLTSHIVFPRSIFCPPICFLSETSSSRSEQSKRHRATTFRSRVVLRLVSCFLDQLVFFLTRIFGEVT